MSVAKRGGLLAIILSLLASSSIGVGMGCDPDCPLQWNFSGQLRTGDTFYGKNIALLNNCNPNDKILYTRNILDLNADLAYSNSIVARLSARNKAIWGNADIAPITTGPTKILDSVGQEHKHFVPRHIVWIREIWLEFSINQALCCPQLHGEHTFTLGAFPFGLGRGIALGDAYAVTPGYIGFNVEDAVDQYAFGVKLSGEIKKDELSYDIYCAILDNQSASLSKIGQKILGQQYGRLSTPSRGFGKINYLFAGRLNWTAVDNPEQGVLTFEPYFLVDTDPEQKVEFLADATAKLGTIGLASEYESDCFEFGFDTAMNFGHQCVKGWDRNTIQLQNRNGVAQEINSHVFVNADPELDTDVTNWSAYKAPYVKTGINTTTGDPSDAGTDAQSLVNNATRDASQNGKSIGIATDLDKVSTIPVATTNVQNNELFNADDRFRSPYGNKLKGWMFVTDAAWCLCNKDVRIAGTVGYASGDADPNIEAVNKEYRGFIGLQEIYAGKRVRSAFVLGGSGRLRLPLDIPSSRQRPTRFGARTSGFTNLALVGAGIMWEPSDWEKKFMINPNILAYWQPRPARKFDLKTLTRLEECASSFLGTEFNLFFKREILSCLFFYGVFSVFLPGTHFDDIKGKPFDAGQQKILDRLDMTGFDEDALPGIGNNASYTANVGFEYRF